jgi:hypothetical protein
MIFQITEKLFAYFLWPAISLGFYVMVTLVFVFIICAKKDDRFDP